MRRSSGVRRPARRGVFDAAQADVRVAACDRLIDLAEIDVHELGPPAEPSRDQPGDLDVEADQIVGTRRVRFDERGAAFGVAGPAEDWWLLRGEGPAKAGRPVRRKRRPYVASGCSRTSCEIRRTSGDDECENRKDEETPSQRGRL
jgi:hypothetical protein